MMSEPGQRESATELVLAPRGTQGFPLVPIADPAWPTLTPGNALIAVASTGAVTAMNVTAVSLLGPPAPHEFGLGLIQFVPVRYHRVIDSWSERTRGDARAAHPDPLTLSLAVLQEDGHEVRVLMTRRMLGAGCGAPYLVTIRVVPAPWGPIPHPLALRVRYRRYHPSPVDGWTTDAPSASPLFPYPEH